MAKVYADLIKDGTINPKTGKPFVIGDVPEIIRAQVEALLVGDGNAE